MFIQQSEEYILGIEAEIERLKQLRDQVQATIQGEEALCEAEVKVSRKRATKKSAAKKSTPAKAPSRRGRPRNNPAVEA